VRNVSKFARRAVPLTGMLIAAAYKENFGPGQYGPWADWCMEYAGIDKADKRAHLSAIGRMLLAVKAMPRFVKTFNLLFELDSEKLLCLTRLVKPGTDDVSEVITFANHYPVASMSRDRLRRLVKRWQDGNPAGLDEEPETDGKPQVVQQDLPGFERSLDLLHDLEPDTATPMIKSTATAEKAMWGGAVLLQSAINYAGGDGKVLDAEDIDSLKEKLLDMVDALDRIRNRQTEAEEAEEIAACGNEDNACTADLRKPLNDAQPAEVFTGESTEDPSESDSGNDTAEPAEIAACGNGNTGKDKRFTQAQPQNDHCRTRQRKAKNPIGFDIAKAMRDAAEDPEDTGILPR